jgi:hypothetical protein
MTKAELLAACRNIINESANDTGALLSDTGNLIEFIHDATEQVVLDLLPVMPSAFRSSENVTLIAGTANYALTGPILQIEKVERTVTGEPPTELEIIDPVDLAYHTDTGETEADPHSVYFIGDSIYFVKTPSTAKTTYAKVWFFKAEAATMVSGGPAMIPSYAHRLIVYKTCAIIATMLERDTSPYMALYAHRLGMVAKVWNGRFQSQTKFVRPSAHERQGYRGSSEDKDTEW